jgi:hypothetical protein
MLERFNDRARQVLILAQEEARMLNHNYIGTEHILLGLVHEGEGVAAQALESMSISLDEIRNQVTEIIGSGETASTGHFPFTPRARRVLELSLREAMLLGHVYIGTEHILLGLICEGEGVAAQILQKLGADLNRVRQQVIQLLPGGAAGEAGTGVAAGSGSREDSTLLDAFGLNLTQAAREGRLDLVMPSRASEIERAMQVLSRRTKNNPVLVGEPDIAKVPIAEGLAQHIATGAVPGALRDKQLYAMEGGSLLSRVADDPDTGDDLRKAMEEVAGRPDILLFVNDLHVLLQSGLGPETASIAGIFRPFIASGRVRAIAAMTLDEYDSYLAKDPELGDLYQPILIAEPSAEQTIEFLKGMRERYEAHYSMTITDDALIAAAHLTQRYLPDHHFPGMAIDVIDETGAKASVSELYMRLSYLDEEISVVSREKEDAIYNQDFEVAASLRDKEKALLKQKSNHVRTHSLRDTVITIDEEMVAEVVAERAHVSSGSVLASLAQFLHEGPPTDAKPTTGEISSKHEAEIEPERDFAFLHDQPIENMADDFLGSAAIAEAIARLINVSRTSTPFTLAVDGGWGTGKSTLLRQIEACLLGSPDVVSVRFNAWTAEGGSALGGLIKSVLVELDSSLVRRWVSKLGKRRGMIGVARIGLAIIARILGLSRLVDEVLTRMSVDAQSRNELRDLVKDMLSDWVQDGDGHHRRTLVVFIDDLDRCTDEAVISVCEAVKLYLDAPGLIFVMACDLSMLARGVSHQVLGDPRDGYAYLEKIVQVAHRVPVPDESRIRGLIEAYAAAGGVGLFVDELVTDILAEQTSGNPRRIKRVLNSFILESACHPDWRLPPLGSSQLITVTVLQHLYPSFYDFLTDEGSGEDPIGIFLDYVRVQSKCEDPPRRSDPWWSTVSKIFRQYGLPPPDRVSGDRERLKTEIAQLERWLPGDFPELARNALFVKLIQRVGHTEVRLALRQRLVSRPLGTST